MTKLLLPLVLSLTLGCVKKIEEGGGTVYEDDTGDGGGDSAVVWDDNRKAMSGNFSSAYATGSELYVVTTEGQSWNYDGDLWSPDAIATFEDETQLTGLWGSGAGATLKMVAVGHDGTIIEWTDGAWKEEPEDVLESAAFEAIDGQDATNLIAVGGAGAFSNKGGEWAPMTTSKPKFNDVWYNGTTALAVGDEGGLGWYGRDPADFVDPEEDNGWVLEEIEDVDMHLYGVDGTEFNNIWVVGQAGTVLRWDGTIWRSFDLDTKANLWSVWTPSRDVAYVVGANGEAYRIQSNDGEVTRLSTGIPNVLYFVTGTTEANVWATGARGVALSYGWTG